MDGEIASTWAEFRPGTVFLESTSSLPYCCTCFVVYLATLSVPWTVKHHVAGRLVINEFEGMWKWAWPNLKFHLAFIWRD